MAILYTQVQVEDVQLRAQVALYEVSQSIENGFYYFGSSVYQTYKALQYDIYTLYNIVGNEFPFVTFSPIPTGYEWMYYELVGSLINKIKQFDVYGEFGGAQNPNFQPTGGQTVTVINLVNFNTGKIPFVNQAPVQILNYDSTLQQIYGNNPILAIFLENYTQDEQTPPTLTYAGNNPSGNLLSISYDYPFPVTGYIQISGVAPGSGGSGGGSGTGGAVVFGYTQADLLQDSNQAWYLPLTLTTGTRPAYTESNGVSVTTIYDTTFSPARLYGFANNSAQIISVYVI